VRTASFRSETLATKGGEHVILPALPDDIMAPLFEQLYRSDGPVHIATLHGEDDLIVFAMVPHRPGRHAYHRETDPDDELRISPDMSVGLVVDYLILADRPVVIREVSPQVCIELVEGPDGPARHASPCGASRRTQSSN
jgi:hypothetical protein